ncbi:hypothetical protein ACTNEW_08090 [Blautia sp. HCP3S3_G3]|uniref:hypothetical protein n=1 Tax=Blautia sp. HCP3S3_G3 TaxID=3438913 RepID=UPI003F8C5BBA
MSAYADITNKPAIVIELKWDKTADAAIRQIKDKKYPEILQDYSGNLLLAGINYDKVSKKYDCVIEKYDK